MNKKAFVLMETIIVIIVISIALLTIFKSYNKILSKVKTENKYDTSEYIYMTNYVKEYLETTTVNIFDMSSNGNTPTNHFISGFLDYGTNPFKIKSIYLLKNINSQNTGNNLKKFDAYMIDYIKKLDVSDNDIMLIVEYKRNALDDKGNEKKEFPNDKQLQETYIDSLEWNNE